MSNTEAVFNDWHYADLQAKAWKKIENDRRAQVVDAFSDKREDGTERVPCPIGGEIKITHSINYTLDNANDFEKLDKALTAIEKVIGEELTNRLVKRKMELSVSEYKKLPPKAKQLIDAVLTTKPGSKSVEYIPPIAT